MQSPISLESTWHSETHFILAFQTARGPKVDIIYFQPLLVEVLARVQLSRMSADAGYDSEANHRFAISHSCILGDHIILLVTMNLIRPNFLDLRTASTALCGLVVVLLVVFWVRSYSWMDVAQTPNLAVSSKEGQLGWRWLGSNSGRWEIISMRVERWNQLMEDIDFINLNTRQNRAVFNATCKGHAFSPILASRSGLKLHRITSLAPHSTLLSPRSLHLHHTAGSNPWTRHLHNPLAA